MPARPSHFHTHTAGERDYAHSHDVDDDHDHDHEEGSNDPILKAFLYDLDNVELTTVGIDVGSSTYNFMFSQVHLQRATEGFSSRFDIVETSVLWQSEPALTPYRRQAIDSEAVSLRLREAYERAGLKPDQIDGGAVILTGQALRQRNAQALAEALALDSGQFVCVSAGHHLESLLAAHGSGAVARSREHNERVLHIDVGGGTTKLALIDSGVVRATAAVMVGGRQIAWSADRAVTSLYAGARSIARSCDIELAPGRTLTAEDQQRFVAAQVDVLATIVASGSSPLERRLRLTRKLPVLWRPDAITLSGGVAEYVYGRESSEFGDLGLTLGTALKSILNDGQKYPRLVDPGQGIRATVVGASQRSVQLSGNTIFISDRGALPLLGVPVIHPRVDMSLLGDPSQRADLAAAVTEALVSYGASAERPVALAVSWSGEGSYVRLATLAGAIRDALNVETSAPAVVLVDADIARSLGRMLTDLDLGRPYICADGLQLSPFDFVDIGRVMEPSGVLPIVIKSLLFGSTATEGASAHPR